MYRCLRGAPDGASHHICHRASTHAHALLQRPKRAIYNDTCLFVLRTKAFMSACSPSTARRPHDATKHAKYDPPHNKTRIVYRRISRNTYRAQPLSCPQRTLRKVRAIPILVPQMRRTQRFSVVFWCLWRGIPRRVAIVPCPTGCVRLSTELRFCCNRKQSKRSLFKPRFRKRLRKAHSPNPHGVRMLRCVIQKTGETLSVSRPLFGDPPGIRTPDHRIKSAVLYRLS